MAQKTSPPRSLFVLSNNENPAATFLQFTDGEEAVRVQDRFNNSRGGVTTASRPEYTVLEYTRAAPVASEYQRNAAIVFVQDLANTPITEDDQDSTPEQMLAWVAEIRRRALEVLK